MSDLRAVRKGSGFPASFFFILTLSGLVVASGAASVLERLRSVSAAPAAAGLPAPQSAAAPAASSPAREQARKLTADFYGALPLGFEPNRGQAAKEAKFLSRGAGYQLTLAANEAVLKLRRPALPEAGAKAEHSVAAVRDDEAAPERARPSHTARTAPAPAVELGMKLVGANPSPRIEGERELAGRSNYLVGKDPARWRTNLPTFSRARYRDVYPGIDLLFYGNQRQLEYDFIVSPGARADKIRLAFRGATKIEIDARGDLVLNLPGGGGALRQSKPVLYQEVEGARREVEGSYVLHGKNLVGFRVGAYDPALALVIDPVLVYSTYLDFVATSPNGGIAIDAADNVYLTGSDGADGANVYVAKLNAAGTGFVYVTSVGGDGGDDGVGIAVDAAGHAYVSGNAYSHDFPTVNAFQPEKSGAASNIPDAFVLKLDAAGANLIFSTFLGGENSDANYGLALDAAGNAYVTGYTESPVTYVNAPPGAPFPTVNPYQGSLAGENDAFLAKFSPVGAVVYSTYLGGTGKDLGLAVAVDDAGAAYVTGVTDSANYPTRNPLQATLRGVGDLFVTKFNPAGDGLVYSTYLGGTGEDVALGLALDASRNAYLTGYTYSTDYPTLGAARPASGGGADAFVTKLNAAGSALIYSTYVGGSRGEQGSDIALGADGSAFVTGSTSSLNFPTVNPVQPTNAGGVDAVLFKLNPSGGGLVYSTYLGGGTGTFGGGDYGQGVALDASGNAVMLGRAYSSNFPVVNPIASASAGGDGAFLAKVSEAGNQTLHRISGRIESNVGNPINGFTVTLSGSQSATIETNSSYYSFNGLPAGGTYTVTPTRAGMTFDPPSQTFANLQADQTADFMQAPRTYHITGRVTNAQGQGIPNLVVEIAGGTFGLSQRYTDAEGDFVLMYLPGGRTYTVTPRSDLYSFTPRSRTFADMRSNQTANFTAVSNENLSISLTSPAHGATFKAPATISLSAAAASTGRPISRVEFYANSALVGSAAATTAPYAFEWADVPSGKYEIQAVVVDSAGAEKRSGKAEIIVSSLKGPVVALTSPPDGATLVADRYVTLSADAASPNGGIIKVEFYEGARLLGTDSTGGSPYTLNYYLSAGSYELTAVATDASGEVTRSAPVRLTVRHNQPPAVELLNPEGGPFYPAGSPITIEARASDPDGSVSEVKFYANSTVLGTDAAAPYSFTWTNAPVGAHTLVVAATDNDGTTAYSNYIDIRVGNSTPTVTLLSPTGNEQYGAPASIGMSASPFDHDGTITQVEFLASNVVVGIDTTAPYSFTWNNVPAGNYDVVARATDNEGATAYSTHVLARVYPSLPLVRLVRPDGGGARYEGPASIVLEAAATNPNSPITSVWFYANGRNVGVVNDGDGTYGMTWSGVLAGNYTVTAQANSADGSVGTSAPVQITVGGAAWKMQEPRNEALTTASVEDAFMISATEGWAVDERGSVIHTTDGGLTWVKQNSGTTEPLNAVHFKDALHGWAAGNDMIYTVDGGRTWQQSNWVGDTVYGLTCADLNTCFASRGLNYFHKTTDGGRNWVVVTMPFEVGIPQFFDAQNGVASGQGGVLRTTDGGQTWSVWSRAHGGRFINFDEGWSISGNTAQRTTDGGRTWEAQTLPPGTWIYDHKFFDAQNGIAVGSQENIVRTTDGGRTWTTVRAPTFPYPLWSVSYGDAAHLVAVGGGGTALSSADGGQTWTRSARTEPTQAVNRMFATGPDRAWTASDGAQLMRTTNGGADWARTTLAPPAASDASDIHFLPDSLNGWATLRGTGNTQGFIYRSTDGGQTWQLNAAAPAGGPLHGVQALDAQTVVAVGATPGLGRVIRSADGGRTWTTPSLPTNTGGLRAVHFVNATTGYAVGTNTILKSTDGGQTWQRKLSLFTTLEDVSFADENNGWAVGEFQLLRTTDGGQTWTQQYENAQADDQQLKGVYAVSPTVAWIVGNRGFVSRTTTGGQLWRSEQLETSDASYLRAVHFLDENNGWIGGSWTSGQIYRRAAITNSGGPTVSITEPVNGASFPANSSLTISAAATSPAGPVMSVDFYVGHQRLGTDGAAPYQMAWPNIPAGVYTLTAIVTDSAGAQSSSAPVTVTSQRPITPTVFITSPANGAAFPAPANVTVGVQASAADSSRFIARVEIYEGTNLIATDTSAPYGTVLNNLGEGSYRLTAKAFDNLGAEAQSGPVEIRVGGIANQPPSVVVTSPLDSSSFDALSTVTVTANASDADGTIGKVDFFANDAFIGTDTSAPYSIQWANVQTGNYSLTARATDNNVAATVSRPVAIRVTSTQAPGLTLGGRVVSPTGRAMANVTVTLGGAASRTANTDADGKYAFTNLTAGGNYTLIPSVDQGGSYIFDPTQHNVLNLQSDQTRDFVGTNLDGDEGDTGAFMISEFRFSGPAGPLDEFIEFYNNSGHDITIRTADGSAGWAVVASDGVVRFVIPAGTVIPARAHYLATNSAYSLGAYAPGDVLYTVDIPDGAGIAIFKTANPTYRTTGMRFDAFGFGTVSNTLYREGFNASISSEVRDEELSYVRKTVNGVPQDTDENGADFTLLATGRMLGAPGPENLASPVQRNAFIKPSLVDPQAAATAAPNRVRSGAGANPTNAAYGTLTIRRKFTNKTGQTVTRLRFRIVDMTTLGTPNTCGGCVLADLRALTSGDAQVPLANGLSVIVRGTLLEQSATQPAGGGLNSALTVPLAGGGLAPNASINVQFLLGVQREGNFRFLLNVEALPGPGAAAGNASKKDGATGKQAGEGGKAELRQP